MDGVRWPRQTPRRAHRDCDQRAVSNPLVGAAAEPRLATAGAVGVLRFLEYVPAGQSQPCVRLYGREDPAQHQGTCLAARRRVATTMWRATGVHARSATPFLTESPVSRRRAQRHVAVLFRNGDGSLEAQPLDEPPGTWLLERPHREARRRWSQLSGAAQVSSPSLRMRPGSRSTVQQLAVFERGRLTLELVWVACRR